MTDGDQQYFHISVPPRPGDRCLSAEYCLWVPDEAPALRGVIVKQHGCEGRTGLHHAADWQWQALARKWDCALLGTRLTQAQDCTDWAYPDGGSGGAFLEALRGLSAMAGRPELASVPWALWGHSGGAAWAVTMTALYPERVVAAVLRSGAGPFSPDDRFPGVPILWGLGGQEDPEVIRLLTDLFRDFRRQGALWSLAIDPTAHHDTGGLRRLAIPYLDAVFAQRLPLSPEPLPPMDTARAWLGEIGTAEVRPAGVFTGDAQTAAWLPDEAAARRWREFVRSGGVTESASPPAPSGLRTIRNGDGSLRLTWQAKAGLTSGIARFSIYDGGTFLGSVTGQNINGGDEPDPPYPKLCFSDRRAVSGTGRTYRVTAISPSGQESVPCVVY